MQRAWQPAAAMPAALKMCEPPQAARSQAPEQLRLFFPVLLGYISLAKAFVDDATLDEIAQKF